MLAKRLKPCVFLWLTSLVLRKQSNGHLATPFLSAETGNISAPATLSAASAEWQRPSLLEPYLRRLRLGATSLAALGLVLVTDDTIARHHRLDRRPPQTDWFTATNWSAGVPTSAVDTIIATVAPNATVVGAAGAQAHLLVMSALPAPETPTIHVLRWHRERRPRLYRLRCRRDRRRDG